jgi:FlaA1/EpsC-like NDP-sugar epimerase
MNRKCGVFLVNIRPWIVFYVAGYQNIAFMESYPYYSIDVNIAGTKLLADLSVEYRVKRFINLSSDMAMNPVSLMGASKRIGEMYLEALAQTKNNPTRFVSVRFGQLAVPGSMELQVIEQMMYIVPEYISHNKGFSSGG